MISLINDSNRTEHLKNFDGIHFRSHQLFFREFTWTGLKSKSEHEHDDYDVPGAAYIPAKAGDEITAEYAAS